MSRFFKVATAGHDPTEDNRESELPVGLEVCLWIANNLIEINGAN